jgi:uncharacterized phage protein (TIGR01671 family)
MNREIKFEYGFDSVNGIVKKVYHLHEIPSIQQKCNVWNVSPIKYVRQYTGLKDKNGNEIYEGDIVKKIYYPLGTNPEVFEYSTIGVIGFKYNSFGMIHKFDIGTQLIPDRCLSHQKNTKNIALHPTVGKDYFDDTITFIKIIVIGNIFENPELLSEPS